MDHQTLLAMWNRLVDTHDSLVKEKADLEAEVERLTVENRRLVSEVARLGLHVQGLEQLLRGEVPVSGALRVLGRNVEEGGDDDGLDCT